MKGNHLLLKKMQDLYQKERNYFLFLVVIFILCSFYYFYQHTIAINKLRIEGDFYVYFAASYNQEHGLPFYNPGPYPLVQKNPLEEVSIRGANYQYKFRPYLYLPFLSSLLRPFTCLPFRLVQIYWTWLLFLSYLAGAAILLWYHRKREGMSDLLTLLFVFGGFFWIPTYTAFIAGQITPVVFLCLILHFLCWKKQWRTGSGICLGTAILLKLSPVLLLALWLGQREWKIAMAAVLTVLCGVIYSGWGLTWYFVSVILPHISLGENDTVNLALLGFSHRYVFGQPWSWLSMSQVQAHGYYLWFIKGFLLTGWIVTCWGVWKKNTPAESSLFFASFLCALLLFSPVTRCYDFIYLFLALFILCLDCVKHPSGLAIAVILLVAAMNLFSAAHGLSFLFSNPVLQDIAAKPFPLSALLLWLFLFYQRLWIERDTHLSA